ncbi:MAG: hypothetical protein AAGA95_03925 [Pseudomonadota bacterium]
MNGARLDVVVAVKAAVNAALSVAFGAARTGAEPALINAVVTASRLDLESRGHCL